MEFEERYESATQGAISSLLYIVHQNRRDVRPPARKHENADKHQHEVVLSFGSGGDETTR